MVRVMHYLNQFFAGLGGENRADLRPGILTGAAGPGRLLRSYLGSDGEIVATLYCGDNYAAERSEEARRELTGLMEEIRADVLVAGPAFGSGRYGLACGMACRVAAERGIPAVAAMHSENPAVQAYRRDVLIVPTEADVLGMERAIADLARFALRLGTGAELGPAEEEGYLPRRRRNILDARTGAERIVSMLCDRIHGRPFRTELPLPEFDPVPPAPPVRDVGEIRLAVVTTGGVVPPDNPDHIESWRASRWARYPLDEVEHFTCVHGGFDNHLVREDPKRVVPVDALRALEREGRIGSLYPDVFVTVGNVAPIERARRFGQEIAAALHAADVQAVLLTAT
jgi:betaine reductase